MKRVYVTFDDDQYDIIKRLKGFGKKDSTKVRNIVVAYLSEKSYIKDASQSKK